MDTPYSKSFEEFWKAYPRKVGKLSAWRSWKRLQPGLKNVLAALAWQINSDQWKKDGGKYIPHPTTYLNQGRWEDEPDPQPPKNNIARPTTIVSRSGRPMVL